MLEIYGTPISLPTNKVRYVANALGVQFEFKIVDLSKGEHKAEAYVNQLHPAGKVPAINDNGFVLFESNAICKYLAQKAGSDLYPLELTRHAIVNEWIDFSSLHIGNAMLKVFFNTIVAPLFGIDVDSQSEQDGRSFLDNFLPVVDKQLQQNRHLAGDELSLADFTLLANLDPAELTAISLTPYSHLTAWRQQLKQEDFYQKCFADYSDVVKSIQGG